RRALRTRGSPAADSRGGGRGRRRRPRCRVRVLRRHVGRGHEGVLAPRHRGPLLARGRAADQSAPSRRARGSRG
ncbi:unnamed protein product, partial [Prorocentrum cordatum]